MLLLNLLVKVSNKMSNLILIRHGQSEWNLEKRFTGWVDVDLTGQGKLEAVISGELIQSLNLEIDDYYCSFQKRAFDTLKLAMDTLNVKPDLINRAWELNERHYGALTGLNKDEMGKKLGEKKILEFRRSWDIKPEPLSRNNPYHPINIDSYKNVPRNKIPDTESLKDTYERVMPFYKKIIEKKLNQNRNIIIAAHGNSIRAICKFLFNLNEKKISLLEIPTGNPLFIKLNSKNVIEDCRYLDQSRAKNLIAF